MCNRRLNTNDFTKGGSKFCNSYYQASRRAGLDPYALGEALGYLPRNQQKSWAGYTVDDFARELIAELDDGLRSELGLGMHEAPRLNYLKYNRSPLWSAIERSIYTYTEVLKRAGLELNLDDDGLRGVVGNYTHEIIGSELLSLYQPMRIPSFKEVLPSKVDNANVIDFMFLRDNTFKSAIEQMQRVLNIPQSIIMINIDYSISRDISYLREKFYKGYQGRSKLLIIVVFDREFLSVQIPQDVRFRENIRIIMMDDFAKFIAPNNLEFFKLAKKLIILNSSIKRFNDSNFQILDNLYAMAKKKLKEMDRVYRFRQRDLENILRKNKIYYLLHLYS